MTVFTRQIERAKIQIAKKGAIVPYERLEIIKNLLKPWEQTTTKQTEEIKILFLPLNELDKKTVARLEGSEVTRNYTKALMAATGFEPSKNDKITFAGKVWSVVDMNILRPDGEIILTTFILKA